MRILVTGATGSIGRLVVDQLMESGTAQVRALTTNPAKAALPDGVEVARGYVGKPETLGTAFDGVDKVYLAPVPGAVAEVVKLARDAGVQYVVDLAGAPYTSWNSVSVAVEASGVEWTHLWPGGFMKNSLIWADQIRTRGEVRDAYPTATTAPIAMDDIAAIAAAVLLNEGHSRQTYSLTGPESLSRVEQVRLIGQAIGREIPFVELSHDEAVKELSATMGEHAAGYLRGIATLLDHPQQVGVTAADVTGRPATTFAEWASAHADAFR